MKSLLQNLVFSAAGISLALSAGAALAQSTAQTPLSQPVQVSGSVSPGGASNCGFLSGAPVQTLQVTQDFASLTIQASGDSGITLFIEGPNGFTECHTTNAVSGNTIDAPGLMNQGTYSFYIGNANQVPTNYTLTIQQN